VKYGRRKPLVKYGRREQLVTIRPQSPYSWFSQTQEVKQNAYTPFLSDLEWILNLGLSWCIAPWWFLSAPWIWVSILFRLELWWVCLDLHRRSYVFNHFENKALKNLKSYNMFKTGRVLSRLSIFKRKGGDKVSRLVLTNLASIILRQNRSQVRKIDAY